MFLGFGWAIIQTSREDYVTTSFEELDDLDEVMREKDRELHRQCRDWLETHADHWLIWQFIENLNNHSNLLHFCTSRNHRTSTFWILAEFIVEQSQGSYGVLYVHDDEDQGRRTGQDHSESFRVWRMLDGQLTEHDDRLFSPLRSLHAFADEFGYKK
ncbi:MAG: hypothetical protein KC587_11890 [Nitrospira sp.]|nr:hypothetical protein [Nitrospira sp.]